MQDFGTALSMHSGAPIERDDLLHGPPFLSARVSPSRIQAAITPLLSRIHSDRQNGPAWASNKFTENQREQIPQTRLISERAEDSAVGGKVLRGIATEQQICGSPHKDFLMNKRQEFLEEEF